MALDILVVDDEADIRMLVADILEDEGYACRVAGGSHGALAAVAERLPGLVVLDIWLRDSELDGLAILERLMADHPTLPVVMISGHGTIETAVAAIKMGAYDFIEKPFKADRLLMMIKRALDAARLTRENAELRLRTGAEWEMIGESASISQVRAAMARVAPTQSRVLITGPPGAGKEAAARMIHESSARRDAPFVVLNCATMSPDRMEVELFGTERAPDGADNAADGAADSARGRRFVGTFEQAHGGTLLLDEVADMPLETQGKIVRVLQEQTFQRVGGATEVRVDVRVMATSSRDLDQEMADGRFRQDLFYRLSVVPIAVPPLTARRDDIPLLVRHFIARSADQSGIAARLIGEDAIASLQAYAWPGNVRQLRNAVDWILIMAPGEPDEPVRADMLPPEIIGETPEKLPSRDGAEVMGLPLREAREIFERQYLAAQIDRFGGNISRTASFVGMERSALHRKLKSLGVGPADTRAGERAGERVGEPTG